MSTNNAARLAGTPGSTRIETGPRPPPCFSPKCTLLLEALQRNHDSRYWQATALDDLLETERTAGHGGENLALERARRVGAAPWVAPASRVARASRVAPARQVGAARHRGPTGTPSTCSATGPRFAAPAGLSELIENTQGVEDILGPADRYGALMQKRVGTNRRRALD
jgi:hypothetical protein